MRGTLSKWANFYPLEFHRDNITINCSGVVYINWGYEKGILYCLIVLIYILLAYLFVILSHVSSQIAQTVFLQAKEITSSLLVISK